MSPIGHLKYVTTNFWCFEFFQWFCLFFIFKKINFDNSFIKKERIKNTLPREAKKIPTARTRKTAVLRAVNSHGCQHMHALRIGHSMATLVCGKMPTCRPCLPMLCAIRAQHAKASLRGRYTAMSLLNFSNFCHNPLIPFEKPLPLSFFTNFHFFEFYQIREKKRNFRERKNERSRNFASLFKEFLWAFSFVSEWLIRFDSDKEFSVLLLAFISPFYSKLIWWKWRNYWKGLSCLIGNLSHFIFVWWFV